MVSADCSRTETSERSSVLFEKWSTPAYLPTHSGQAVTASRWAARAFSTPPGAYWATRV